MKKEIDITKLNLKEHLFYAYANLAMAHAAVENNQTRFDKFNYAIRAKLYKGLLTGKMNIRTLFDDEKIKLSIGAKCNYCNSTEKLALDHILAQKLGGKDNGDNLVYACKSCNSSKQDKPWREWYRKQLFYKPEREIEIMRLSITLVSITAESIG